MKIIDIRQNSPEWYEYRRTRIGASDFNYFCKHKGLYTPYYYNSPYYKSKCGGDTLENHFYNKINNVWVDNLFMARGRELEPSLLEEYNKLTGGCYVPTVGQYDCNSDIFASFDGYDAFIDDIVEIKTTAKSPEFEKQLLESYICQCIHQMNVVDKESMVIIINYYNYGITRHYLIEYEQDSWSIIIRHLNRVCLHIGIKWNENSKYSGDTNWELYCNEYLKLLKEKTNG